VIQSAFADVENALISREKLTQQVDAEARRVKALTEYARLAKLQYDDGYSNYLTVLNAQQQLLPAEINYAQNLGQKYSALVNIYKSMGGGWVDKADALAPQPAEDSSMLAAPIPRSEAASSTTPTDSP
jgi:outer membrane protein, multidrug efflux system